MGRHFTRSEATVLAIFLALAGGGFYKAAKDNDGGNTASGTQTTLEDPQYPESGGWYAP